jgi:hypothetical protein
VVVGKEDLDAMHTRDITGDVPHATADICERTREFVARQPQDDKSLQLSDALRDRPYNRRERERKLRPDVHKGHHWQCPNVLFLPVKFTRRKSMYVVFPIRIHCDSAALGWVLVLLQACPNPHSCPASQRSQCHLAV